MNCRRHRWVVLAIVAGVAGPWSAGAAEPAAVERPNHDAATEVPTSSDKADEIAGLRSDEWREPRVPVNILWQIFLIPERVVEVSAFPIAVLVNVVEKYRIDKRVVDFLTNDAGTFKVTPKAKFAIGDGFGLGAAMTFEEFFGGEERWDLSGLWRLDGDYDIKTRYRQAFARLEGRRLEVRAEYELDKNEPYYGIGNQAPIDDRRDLQEQAAAATLTLDLTKQGMLRWTGKLELGYTHQRYAPGTGTRGPVGAAGDTVEPPPGFEQSLDYPHVGFQVKFDTRDRIGRPTRGTVAVAKVRVTSDVNGSELNAAAGSLTVSQYIEVLPLFRVLVLHGGIAGAVPLTDDSDVPYHELVSLGRDTVLRGYNRERFTDRYGWWGSAQYQFPITEYMSTGVALNAGLFFELGRVGEQVEDLISGTIHYSYGLGLGVAHTTKSVASIVLGMSPEGVEFLFAGGLEL